MNKPRSQPPQSAPASQDAADSPLSLDDSGARPGHAGSGNAAAHGRPVGGYDPYDVSPDALAAAARAGEPRGRAKDLRKLSEWIRLRRQVDALKQDQAPEKDDPAAK